jgi:hypothetical protein
MEGECGYLVCVCLCVCVCVCVCVCEREREREREEKGVRLLESRRGDGEKNGCKWALAQLSMVHEGI